MDQYVILGGPSKEDINMILDKLSSLTSELNHIGNNINQISKHANTYGNISDNLNLCLEEL